MFKFLINLFKIKKKMCSKDTTKECTFDYNYDRNGKMYSTGSIYYCCKFKPQIEAARKLKIK
jgi:hypothetical protein